MVEKGLADHGWSYVNIDDGWQGRRGGQYNAIQPNEKFPDMVALTREIHDMGLRVGIYSTPWIGTYAAHIGSYSDRPDGETSGSKRGCTTRTTVIKNRTVTTGMTDARFGIMAPTPSWMQM